MSDLSNMTSTELMDYANRLLYNLSSRQDFNNLPYEDQIAVTSMYRPVFTDLKEAPAQKRGKVSVTNLPAKKLTKNLDIHQLSNDFEEPEYDFKEITTLMDVESYILRGYKKRLAHMLKDGYSVIGKNIRNVDYVKSRIEEIEFLTDMSFLEFLREMGFYFLTRSTALAIKIRSNIGLGRRRTSNYTARILNPVKGFMLIDPAYAQAQFGPNYKPKAFRIYSPDDYRYQDFPREDVLYFYKNRKYGHWCGTPDLVPAAQDIATLRSLESNIELFFYQHLFPLYQYRVGTAERDAAVYPNGEREIDQVRSEIRKMPPEGLIITPYRHEIKPISEGANFTSLVEIHEIFKKRVFAALGMSSIDFGESNACYASDTEVLTETGWKTYDEIGTDKIAVFNPSSNLIQFEKPLDKFVYDYNGEMIHFSGKYLDTLVTPNHDMWVKSRWGNKDWEKVQAGALANRLGNYSDFHVRLGAGYENKDSDSEFYLPPASRKRGRAPKEIKCELGVFAEFLGWFISEGCLDKYNGDRGYYRTLLCQKEGPKLDWIIDILTAMGVTFKVKSRRKQDDVRIVTVYSKTLYDFLSEHVPHGAKNKLIPPFVFEWPNDVKLRFLEAAIAGDGSTNKGYKKHYSFNSSSKQFADDIQRLALSLGYMTVLHEAPISYKGFSSSSGSVMYRVHINMNPGKLIHMCDRKRINKEHYKGKVFCFQTSTGLMVVRRNGKIIVAGNSTRATANALSAQLINDIKDDIRIFTAFLRTTLFNEFLFEAPFSYNPLNFMEQVSIKFPDPDQESRLNALKIVADAFQWNLLSRRESREEYLGFDPMEAEDAMDTYVEIAEKNKIKTQGETDIEVEKSKPKPVVKPAAKPKPKKKTKSAFLSEYQVSMVKEFDNIATALQTDTLDEVELERQLRATFNLAKSISNSEKTRDSFLDSINEIKTLSPIIKEDTNNIPYVTETILNVFTSIFDEGFDETSLDNTEESV